MMDDFKRPPERPQVRLDSLGGNVIRPGQTIQPQATPSPAFAAHAIPQHAVSEPAFYPPAQPAPSQVPGQFLPPLEHHPELPEHTLAPVKKRFSLFRKPDLTKKQWIIVVLASVLVIGGGTAAALMLNKEEPKPVVKKAPAKVAPAPPPPILSPLSGLVVTEEQKNRPVTGVMIENSSNARPQSGMDQAGVVFEAIAEYGITRFLALYQENSPSVVGPVRSARPYFLDWNMAFNASYAHVGGSPEAMQLIKDRGIRDLDQFHNSGAYRRVSHRFAPHNMYTDINALVDVGNSKGYTASTFTPLVRKEKEQPSSAPTAKTIDLAISGAFYNVQYDYDQATNSYKRSMGGAPHTDAETSAQLSPKVVIALGIPYSLKPNGLHSNYQTVGSGNMLLFQDGVVTAGTWSKADPAAQFIFKDGAGADMKLNPGQTWITALGDITKATYAP